MTRYDSPNLKFTLLFQCDTNLDSFYLLRGYHGCAVYGAIRLRRREKPKLQRSDEGRGIYDLN